MIQNIFTLTCSPLAIFERFLILALGAALALWLYCVIRCHFSNGEKTPQKITVRRALIESALVGIVAFAIYFAFFVKSIGWQRFVWDEWHWAFSRNTYLML